MTVDVKVGVVLPRPPGDPGEWLADAAAFEAAGADALWMDHGRAPQLDPLVLTAALAALTYRSLLVAAVPEAAATAALATVDRLSHGRLVLIADASALQTPGMRIVRRLPEGIYEEEAGRWASAAPPPGRAAWRQTLLQAAERGDRGVLVPADPRLLDILRNPEDPGGRHDLQLAQG